MSTKLLLTTGSAISAADANRKFSQLLRGVAEGNSYVVTSHGRPVARLVPWSEDEQTSRREAWLALLDELAARPAIDIGSWTREELYDRWDNAGRS